MTDAVDCNFRGAYSQRCPGQPRLHHHDDFNDLLDHSCARHRNRDHEQERDQLGRCGSYPGGQHVRYAWSVYPPV